MRLPCGTRSSTCLGARDPFVFQISFAFLFSFYGISRLMHDGHEGNIEYVYLYMSDCFVKECINTQEHSLHGHNDFLSSHPQRGPYLHYFIESVASGQSRYVLWHGWVERSDIEELIPQPLWCFNVGGVSFFPLPRLFSDLVFPSLHSQFSALFFSSFVGCPSPMVVEKINSGIGHVDYFCHVS